MIFSFEVMPSAVLAVHGLKHPQNRVKSVSVVVM